MDHKCAVGLVYVHLRSPLHLTSEFSLIVFLDFILTASLAPLGVFNHAMPLVGRCDSMLVRS